MVSLKTLNHPEFADFDSYPVPEPNLLGPVNTSRQHGCSNSVLFGLLYGKLMLSHRTWSSSRISSHEEQADLHGPPNTSRTGLEPHLSGSPFFGINSAIDKNQGQLGAGTAVMIIPWDFLIPGLSLTLSIWDDHPLDSRGTWAMKINFHGTMAQRGHVHPMGRCLHVQGIVSKLYQKLIWLVVSTETWWTSSVGMMKFPTEWKVITFHGSSHHQPVIINH
jgi:hypothetical protein